MPVVCPALDSAGFRGELVKKLEESGEIDNYSKKMESQLRREKSKILRNLEGIRYCVLDAEHAAWAKFKHTAKELAGYGGVSLNNLPRRRVYSRSVQTCM